MVAHGVVEESPITWIRVSCLLLSRPSVEPTPEAVEIGGVAVAHPRDLRVDSELANRVQDHRPQRADCRRRAQGGKWFTEASSPDLTPPLDGDIEKGLENVEGDAFVLGCHGFS